MNNIKKSIKNISSSPGVYLFKDKNNDILYIGKAKNLKKRISSYFTKSNKNIKNKVMILKVMYVETIIVNNEVEALIAEANLIKVHKPRYNIFLKDDKTFPYVMITKEPYPRVEIIRKKKLTKDGNIYFGPYTDVNYLRSILKVLHQIFPLRTCSYLINDNVISAKKIKLCLDYHINKCEGPCVGLVSEKKYNKMINQVISFAKFKENSKSSGRKGDKGKNVEDGDGSESQEQDDLIKLSDKLLEDLKWDTKEARKFLKEIRIN